MEESLVRQFFAEMEILSNGNRQPPQQRETTRYTSLHLAVSHPFLAALTVRHDHIVKFLGGCVQPDNLCILFEFCPQSLYDLLSHATEALTTTQILRIAHQVALGIFYLHSSKPPVLHLDLKSANVLLDDYGKVKVCDFGLARLKLGSGVLTQRIGSPMWTSPEVSASSVSADAHIRAWETHLCRGSYSAKRCTLVGEPPGYVSERLPPHASRCFGGRNGTRRPTLIRSVWSSSSCSRESFRSMSTTHLRQRAWLPFRSDDLNEQL